MSKWFDFELGDDTLNTGDSDLSPYKRPENKTSFLVSGGSFFLKSGSRFRNAAFAAWQIFDVAASVQFSIEPYNTGARPIYTNNDLVTGFSLHSGSVYKKTYSNWGRYSSTASFVSQTRINISGANAKDPLYRFGRRIRLNGSGGPWYGTITSPDNTVSSLGRLDFTLDSGTLDNTVSSVDLSGTARILLDDESQSNSANVAGVNATDKWFQSGSELYIYGDPSLLTIGVEVVGFDKDLIVVKNPNGAAKGGFKLDGVELHGGPLNIWENNGNTLDNTIINNNRFSNQFRRSVLFGNFATDNAAVTNNIFDFNLNGGEIENVDDGNKDALALSKQSTNSNYNNNKTIDYTHAGIIVDSATDFKNNIISYNEFSAPNANHGRGWQFGGTVSGATNNASGNFIRYNIEDDCPSHTHTGMQATLYYGNAISNKNRETNNGAGLNLFTQAGSDTIRNLLIFCNVLTNCDAGGIRLSDNGGAGIINNTGENNIILNCGAPTGYDRQIIVNNYVGITGNTWRKNTLFRSGVVNLINYKGTVYTIAGAEAATLGDNFTGNFATKDTFANETGTPPDFHIPIGTHVGETHSELDPDGNAYGTSVGAFRYGAGSGSAVWTTRISDDFVGTDGALATASQLEIDSSGQGSAAVLASPVLDTGALKFNAANNGLIYYAGSNNQEIEAPFYPGLTDNRLHLFVRHDGLASGLETTYFVVIRSGVNSLKLLKRIANIDTLLVQVNFTINTALTYIATLKIEGSNLTLKMDGVNKIVWQDSTITQGKYSGFQHGSWVNNIARLNSVLIKTDTFAPLAPISSNGVLLLDSADFVDCSPTTNSAWKSTIVSDPNVTGVMVRVSNTAGGQISCGVRRFGDTFAPTSNLSTSTHTMHYVGLGDTGKDTFQTYTNDTVNSTFEIVGYFRGESIFLSTPIDVTPTYTVPGWYTVDITAQAGSDVPIFALLEIDTVSNGLTVGLRPGDSAAAYTNINSVIQRHIGGGVGVDSAKSFDVYLDSAKTNVRLLGYMIGGVIYYVSPIDYGPAITASYQPITTLPANAIGYFFDVCASYDNAFNIRKNGDADDQYFDPGTRKAYWVTKPDSNGDIQAKLQNADTDMRLMAIFTSTAGTHVLTAGDTYSAGVVDDIQINQPVVIPAVVSDAPAPTDNGLGLLIHTSLFTDKHAHDDAVTPGGKGDVRGWWGDSFALIEGDQIGSDIWLSSRAVANQGALNDVQSRASAALKHVVDRGLVTKIETSTAFEGDIMKIFVDVTHLDGTTARYTHDLFWRGILNG